MKSKVELITILITDLALDAHITIPIAIEYLEEIQAHTQERINALREGTKSNGR